MPPSPEYSLLLDAIIPRDRPRVDYRDWDGGRWGETLNIADWHRLSPALFCHLQAGSGASPAALSALERAYLANAARMLFVRSALQRVIGALDGAGVQHLLLKGAALVETVYGDPAQREMLDVDILIPEDQLRSAAAALAPVGYREDPSTDVREDLTLRVAPLHDRALIGQEQLVAVELHRHITTAQEGRHFTMDGFWERARTVASTGHRVPSPEDLLLHVAFHFTRNRLGGSFDRRNTGGALAQICDIHRIVHTETVDWDLIVETARSYHLATRVFIALFAACELGAEIPPDALARLQPLGFDRKLGQQLVTCRVLRADEHLPVRSVRWMFAPSREVLSRGWNADPTTTLSLAQAYLRRARAHAPAAQAAMRRPWELAQDRRLNSRIQALEDRA